MLNWCLRIHPETKCNTGRNHQAYLVCYVSRRVPIIVMNMNGPDLLAAYRSGSEDAFSELVRRYTNLVYSIAKRRLSSSPLAEEVAQTVFARLANSAPKFNSDAEFVAWIHRTSLNV